MIIDNKNNELSIDIKISLLIKIYLIHKLDISIFENKIYKICEIINNKNIEYNF